MKHTAAVSGGPLGGATAGITQRTDAGEPNATTGAPVSPLGKPGRSPRSPATWVEHKTRPFSDARSPLLPPEVGDRATDAPLPPAATVTGYKTRTLLEWIAVFSGALLAALLIKTFLLQAFVIPSESMVSTLEIGDRVLVNKLSYRVGTIERGDVVVIHRPPAARSGADNTDLIKRVIGLPGETVDCVVGQVTINGEPLQEQWLPRPFPTENCGGAHVLGPHELFMMGDNRPFSRDSRSFGPVDESLVVGRGFIRIWPLRRLGGL